MNELTHLDLFSGIGGFALAAQWAGFRTVGFSEVEPYACRVLAERFPGVPNFGDVRKSASFAGLRGVTVMSAGYPCQPASLAGKRRGQSDNRWLWPAARDLLSIVRPTWFIGENVFGHVSMGLDGVLADLEGLGYAVQPFVVPACAVGAWHRRDRLWIVAHTDGVGGRAKQEPRAERKDSPDAHDDGAARASANAHGRGKLQSRGHQSEGGRRALHGTVPNDADVSSLGPQGRKCSPGEQTGGGELEDVFAWPVESPVVRVVHGLPDRAHRIKGLGNAIVPQVAERFFRWIAQIERGEVAA